MVPTPKWQRLAVPAGMLLVAGTLLLTRHRIKNFLVRPVAAVLPADGREHAVLLIDELGNGPVKVEDLTAEVVDPKKRGEAGKVRLTQAGNNVEVWMRAPTAAGERRVQIRLERRILLETVRFAPTEVDSFEDGLPDALRLHSSEDRAAFRQWFWRLAELQTQLPDAERAGEIQDCAALLRYAYREALKKHDSDWAETQHVGDIAFESVEQWRYPETMLGAGSFRVRPGPFIQGDESNGAFTQFADAHALMSWNTYRVGRDLKGTKPGDLIFYRQLGQNSPYHSMILTGNDADWVVYHTGPIGKHKGEMRRMALADLLRHPDTRWRPVVENSNFLGVFRWNLLREGD